MRLSRPPRAVAAVYAAVFATVFAVAVAGCGAQPAAAPPSSSPAAADAGTVNEQASTASARPGASSAWVIQRDPQSGITFKLPRRVKPTTHAGVRDYQALIRRDHILVDVGFYPPLRLDGDLPHLTETMADRLKAAMTSGGATGATRSQVTADPLDGEEAYDYWFGFVSHDGSRNTWRVTVAACGPAMVVLQSIHFGPRTVDARPAVLAEHRRLRAGLRCH